MLLTEITEEISALSRFEKILLIEQISKMLLAEENPTKYFDLQQAYPVLTPLEQDLGASQLQQFINQKKS